MALSTRLADDVPDTIRRRGKSYYGAGAVRIREGDAEWVEATVRGTERYRVRIGRDGDTLFGSCTCPYYKGNLEVCKHLWATVLAAEAAGYLKSPGGRDPLHLEPEGDGEDGDAYDDQDYEDDEVEAFR